jgi:hypothetical protein
MILLCMSRPRVVVPDNGANPAEPDVPAALPFGYPAQTIEGCGILVDLNDVC